jgi:hypothetical protein
MTIVSRKCHSTHDTGQEPEAKIQRNSSNSKKQRKPKKTNNGTFRKDSKKTKAAGKYFCK